MKPKKEKKAGKEQTHAKEERKSKFALWWETYDPIIVGIVDMRAVLK